MDDRLNVFRFANLSVDEYLATKLCEAESHREIAKVCIGLLCAPSWEYYDTTKRTKQGEHRGRHLLLYAMVFWPWHLARDAGNDCRILAGLWDRFLLGEHCRRWLDLLRRNVMTWKNSRDAFWRRAYAVQQGGHDVLTSVCVFGLVSKLTSVFESVFVEKARIDWLLLQACSVGDLNVAGFLLDRKADIAVADEDGQPLLHIALQRREKKVARFLIDRGADVTTADACGRTALHLAAMEGSEVVVRWLADRGADVSASDYPRWKTLLHLH